MRHKIVMQSGYLRGNILTLNKAVFLNRLEAMATDRHLGPETNPSPAEDAVGGPMRELAEALTALGHYLAAADRILLEGPKPEPAEALREVLASSMAQYERAVDAARRLRKP
jgi:hypothetical protein